MAAEIKDLTQDRFWTAVSISRFSFEELLQNNEDEKDYLQVQIPFYINYILFLFKAYISLKIHFLFLIFTK